MTSAVAIGGAAPPVEAILGFPVASLARDECIDLIHSRLTNGCRQFYVACANPHSLVVARDDGDFRAALLSADLLIPDGAGIVLASRMLGGQIRVRVTGSDVFLGLNERLSRHGPRLRCFFLGSTAETLREIERRMGERFPGVEVAGCFSPPFRDAFTPEDDEAMVAAVNRVRPNVLWVGMTAPKQEKLVARIRDRLDVQLVAAVGAVFDFFSGVVARSHPSWQRIGLEWFPRLVRQPHRLWRRTVVSAPVFLWRVLQYRFARCRLE